MKRVLGILFILLVMAGCSYAEVDIVGYINSAVTGLTTEQKQDMLDYFCTARGYQELYDEEGNLLQTKKQFMNKDLINYIKIMVDNQKAKEKISQIVIEPLTIE